MCCIFVSIQIIYKTNRHIYILPLLKKITATTSPTFPKDVKLKRSLSGKWPTAKTKLRKKVGTNVEPIFIVKRLFHDLTIHTDRVMLIVTCESLHTCYLSYDPNWTTGMNVSWINTYRVTGCRVWQHCKVIKCNTALVMTTTDAPLFNVTIINGVQSSVPCSKCRNLLPPSCQQHGRGGRWTLETWVSIQGAKIDHDWKVLFWLTGGRRDCKKGPHALSDLRESEIDQDLVLCRVNIGKLLHIATCCKTLVRVLAT